LHNKIIELNLLVKEQFPANEEDIEKSTIDTHLSDDDLDELKTLIDTLDNTSFWHSNKLNIPGIKIIMRCITRWPSDKSFPFIDLLR